MTEQSTNLAQSKYRRGTILGLTVAEVFILLLFLLMLVFLVLSQEQERRLEAQERKISQQEGQLEGLRVFVDTWKEPLAGIETPDEVLILKRGSEEFSANSPGSALLAGLKEAERQRDEAETEGRELAAENERLRAEQKRQREELEAQQAQNEDLRRQVQEYKVRIKGQNPPCWYEVVPTANGGTREKAFYLFDIAVFDQHMIVRQRPIPPGGAFDDSSRTYAEEAADLPLQAVRYNTPLANNEVEDLLAPLFTAGKESKVRTYSCVFFAQIWDETSDNAKERWQQAHDRILEGLLGTFTVRDEPWQPM